jgi:quinolinate synthase
MQAKTVSWNDIRQQVLAHPEVQAEYEALEEEFKLTRQIISLRKSSGLNQREFAIWPRIRLVQSLQKLSPLRPLLYIEPRS